MTTPSHVRNLMMMVMMLAGAAMAIALKPEARVGAPVASINLANIIPNKFGEWTVDTRVTPVMPPPEVEDLVNKIYDETLARTYVNSKGELVMLSIAYGGDQTGRLRVHRPESCYSAQGFSVDKLAENELVAGSASIPVKRLMAKAGNRHEPITYWIRVGDSTVTSLFGQRLTQLRFGLTGEIPDGLIFRVSSISRQTAAAYALHDRFVADLMAALPAQDKATLIGTVTQAADKQ